MDHTQSRELGGRVVEDCLAFVCGHGSVDEVSPIAEAFLASDELQMFLSDISIKVGLGRNGRYQASYTGVNWQSVGSVETCYHIPQSAP